MTLASDRARIKLMPRVQHKHTDFIPVKVSGRDSVRWQCGHCPFMYSWSCIMSPEEAVFITQTLTKGTSDIVSALDALQKGLQNAADGLKTSGWLSGSGGSDSDPQGPDADVYADLGWPPADPDPYVDPWDAKYKGVVGIDPRAEDFIQSCRPDAVHQTGKPFDVEDIARVFDVPQSVPSRVLARDEPCADSARCDVHGHDYVDFNNDFNDTVQADIDQRNEALHDQLQEDAAVDEAETRLFNAQFDPKNIWAFVEDSLADLGFNQLRDFAKWLNVKGRGNMRKNQLIDAIKLHLTD